MNISRSLKHLHKSVARREKNDLIYSLGYAMQLAPGKACALLSLRMENGPAIDFEGGTDLIVFEDLDSLSGKNAFPVSRNERGENPLNAQPSIFIKYPMTGGFVPLGAEEGASYEHAHPYAGSGFGVCQSVSFPQKGLDSENQRYSWANREDLYRFFEIAQFSFDGEKVGVDKIERIQRDEILPGWEFLSLSLSSAIPDGNDLLLGMQARRIDGERSSSGVAGIARWKKENKGWHISSFDPVDESIELFEPSMIRVADGSLLLCARPSWKEELYRFDILVWRSIDSGQTWTKVIHKKNYRSAVPVSIGRTVDGKAFVAGNLFTAPLNTAPEGKVMHGANREILCVWPLEDNFTELKSPCLARCPKYEFGASVQGTGLVADHPINSIVHLKDDRWHSLLSYRMMDSAENYYGKGASGFTGCCFEEITSEGPTIEEWSFRKNKDSIMEENFVKVGSIVDINDKLGIEHLERFVEYELGNYVILKIHWQKDSVVTRRTIEKAIKFCVEHKIYFSVSEFLDRYTLTPWKILDSLTADDWSYFRKLGGKQYLSNMTVCERGGAVYWPLKYKQGNMLMPEASTMEEACGFYVDITNKALNKELEYNRKNLECIDSSLLHKYHLEAGVDSVALEVFPGNSDLMFPAVRGAMRSKGKNKFGCDIAMAWYGGVKKDELWFKRWKLSLLYSYIAGADWIVSETGEFGIDGIFDEHHEIDGPVCKRFRKILKELFSYVKINKRSGNGPVAKIGIVHGRHDGTPGLWNKEVWGQYQDEKWLEGDPEESWKLINCLLKKSEWFDSNRKGETDLSGNPPFGQFDIIPVESPLEILKNYSCLIFLGWNTMDGEIYNKLIDYVKNGGRLLMSLGHLNVEQDRSKGIKLFNNGNFENLFGVNVKGQMAPLRHAGIKFAADSDIPGYNYPNWTEKVDPKWMDTSIPVADIEIKGAKTIARAATAFSEYQLKKWGETEVDFPVLTEHKLGKGFASLITLWGYPASKGIRGFYEDVLKSVNVGEMDERIKVCASDKVRYSVYENGHKYALYLLNTDFDLPQSARVFYGNGSRDVLIQAASIEKMEITKGEKAT